MTDLTVNLHVRDEYLTVFYNYHKMQWDTVVNPPKIYSNLLQCRVS